MSYFGRDDETLLSDDERCAVQDTECGVEIEDGVVIERRSILWLSAAAVSSMLVGAVSLPAQDPKPAPTPPDRTGPQEGMGKLTHAEFLEQLYPQARRLVDSKGEDEQAYLMTVAAAMSRLRDPKAPIRDAMRKFSKQHRKQGERFPIGVMAIHLKPGKGFSHHDHLNYNGVIMGLEGEARIRNYDFQGNVPAIDSPDTFEIRETRDDLILPGRFSSLGKKRENIHDLVAGKKGARVLDVFTFFAKNATSRSLIVADKPRDAETRTFEATWRPRRRRQR